MQIGADTAALEGLRQRDDSSAWPDCAAITDPDPDIQRDKQRRCVAARISSMVYADPADPAHLLGAGPQLEMTSAAGPLNPGQGFNPTLEPWSYGGTTLPGSLPY